MIWPWKKNAAPTATPPAKAAHMALGEAGEDEAARYLTSRGFSVRHRNWRPEGRGRSLELDLVGMLGETLVFTEVKTRRLAPETAATHDTPAGLANFSPSKQRNMLKAARLYLGEHGLWHLPCRFDLVCVTYTGTTPLVEHFAHVIELGNALDSGDASWQPW